MWDATRYLTPGERVRLDTRPHLLGLVPPTVRRGLQLLALIVITRLIQHPVVEKGLAWEPLKMISAERIPVPEWVARICLYLGVLVMALAIRDWLGCLATRYILTDKRVLRLRGLFRRRALDIPLDRVQALDLEQSVIAEKLDYGRLIIYAGTEIGGVLDYLPQPLVFRRKLHAYREGQGEASPERAATAAKRRPTVPASKG